MKDRLSYEFIKRLPLSMKIQLGLVGGAEDDPWGLDTSWWNIGPDHAMDGIDVEKAQAQHVEFGAVRATVGEQYKDLAFKGTFKSMVDAGMLVTAYMVIIPGRSPRRMVDNFVEALVELKEHHFPEITSVRSLLNLPPVGDWEVTSDKSDPDRVFTGREILDTARETMSLLWEWWRGRYTPPFMYTGEWFINRLKLNYGVRDSDLTWLKQYPLWAAYYNQFRKPPPMFYPYTTYSIHQGDADGNGLGKLYGVWSPDVDRNKFRSRSHMVSMAKPGVTLYKGAA